jgi:hypothetical protein
MRSISMFTGSDLFSALIFLFSRSTEIEGAAKTKKKGTGGIYVSGSQKHNVDIHVRSLWWIWLFLFHSYTTHGKYTNPACLPKILLPQADVWLSKCRYLHDVCCLCLFCSQNYKTSMRQKNAVDIHYVEGTKKYAMYLWIDLPLLSFHSLCSFVFYASTHTDPASLLE